MYNIRQLLAATRSHRPVILRNARRVSVQFVSIEEKKDEEGDTYREVIAKCVGETIPREVTMRFWGRGRSAKMWCSCTCEYHLYHCEWALARRDNSEIIYSNGRPPRETNPRYLAHICKHVAQCLILGAQDQRPKKTTRRTTRKKTRRR